jgi:hypothetical protein
MGKVRLGFWAVSLGFILLLPTEETQALPLGSRPSAPLLVQDAQTVIVIRRHRPWRAHRHHGLRMYRLPPPAAWGGPYFLGSPGYALFPPDDEFMPPSERRRLRLNQNPEPKRAVTENRAKRSKPTTSTAQENPTAPERPKQKKLSRKNTQVAVASPEAAEIPKRQVEQKRQANTSKGLSCDRAARVVSGYAFTDVKPVTCTGTKYRFRAMRGNEPYSVTVSAVDGTLVNVAKQD